MLWSSIQLTPPLTPTVTNIFSSVGGHLPLFEIPVERILVELGTTTSPRIHTVLEVVSQLTLACGNAFGGNDNRIYLGA